MDVSNCSFDSKVVSATDRFSLSICWVRELTLLWSRFWRARAALVFCVSACSCAIDLNWRSILLFFLAAALGTWNTSGACEATRCYAMWLINWDTRIMHALSTHEKGTKGPWMVSSFTCTLLCWFSRDFCLNSSSMSASEPTPIIVALECGYLLFHRIRTESPTSSSLRPWYRSNEEKRGRIQWVSMLSGGSFCTHLSS